MPTTVVETIGTGGDFADISSWVAALPSDLVTADEVRVGRLIDAADYAEASTIDISGITTDATRYVQLEAASGVRHNGTGDASGARYAYTGGGHAFTVGIDHFRTRWIDFSYPSGGGSSDEVFRWSGGGEFWCEFCIGHDIDGAQDQDFLYPSAGTVTRTIYIQNCMFWNVSRAALHNQSESNLTWYVYNVTAWNCGSNSGGGSEYGCLGFSSSPNTSSVMVCKNVFAADAGNINHQAFFDDQANGDFTGSTNNASEDGSAPGTSPTTGLTPGDQFQSLTGTIDLHLVETADLVDAGADLSGDTDLPVTDDIDGETRSGTWDIGADELVAGVTVTPGTGSVVLAGQAPTVQADGGTTVTPAAASLVLQGQTPTVAAPETVDVPTGSLTFTGHAPTVDASATGGANTFVEPATASVVLQGVAPTVDAPETVTPGTASVIFTGRAPTVQEGDSVTVTPAAASLVFQGQAPAVDAPETAQVPSASLALQGQSPTVQEGGSVTVTPGTASVALQGQAPAVDDSDTVTPGAASLVFTTFAPTVQTGADRTVTPGTGSLVLQGQAPTVDDSQSIRVPSGSLVLQGLAPTVDDSDTIAVGSGSLAFTGFSPTVVAAEVIQVPSGSLVLQTFAPTISAPASIEVPTASLVLTGRAPSVTGDQLDLKPPFTADWGEVARTADWGEVARTADWDI